MSYTKAIARFHRLFDRFHRRSVDSMLEASVSLDVALSDRFGLSRGESDVMLQRYSRLEREIADALMRPGTADATLTSLLFLLIVMRKPQRVIETGVWHGVSSYVILSAMKDVGTGRLISIDLPPLNRGARVEVGNVVPQHLREHWSLRLGASDQLLPTAISERSGVDLFIHDSDHSYRNMMIEFRLAWNGLPAGGLLVADDAHANDAIVDFCDTVGRTPCIVQRQKGGAIAVVEK
jgi:predicted O-methyltransferase YrrM